jgi:hypothetical protein
MAILQVAILKFSTAGVRRLLEHCEQSKGKAHLILVKDVGIYLMVDGEAKLLMANGMPFVVYAQGFDAAAFVDDTRALRVKSREAIGGDDFIHRVDASRIPDLDALRHSSLITIEVTLSDPPDVGHFPTVNVTSVSIT